MPGPLFGIDWGGVGAFAAISAVVVAITRTVVPWRKLSIGAEERFRDEVMDRLKTVEKGREDDRVRHEEERAADRKSSNREISRYRHKVRNANQCLDALIIMLEMEPLSERAAKGLALIKEMRERQKIEEALESVDSTTVRDTVADLHWLDKENGA